MTEVCEFSGRKLDRAHLARQKNCVLTSLVSAAKVEFRDEQTGKSLGGHPGGYPLDADIACRRVSVLTPVGAELLGLSVNQTISFRARTGERRELTVLKVSRGD